MRIDIIEREELDHMPYDGSFFVDGHDELCHATGDIVRFEGDERWYTEFVDHHGDYHYR